jgi:hypothetical protein
MRRTGLTAAILVCANVVHAQDIDITGTYRLINTERKVIETGEVIRSTDSVGYITYGKDGRMLALLVRNPRPKPANVEELTDAQRAELFKTMTAYGGTYTFDGKQVVHNIDISWNEAWTGTRQPRYVAREGERLVYTTDPYRFSGDGRMVINRLIWEKVK